MSEPRSNNVPILKWESPIEDKRKSLHDTADEKIQERLHDDVHKARTERKDNALKREALTEPENKPNPEVRLKGYIEKNVVYKRNDAKGHSHIEPYPEAQMSHDADGTLDHIDFRPNNGR